MRPNIPPKTIMKTKCGVPLLLFSVAVTLTLAISSPAEEKKTYNLATVVKIMGINWFNRMENGVKKFGQDTGNRTAEYGPATTDSAQQIRIVADLIAKKVNGLVVIPFQPLAMEPVLKKAMERKIVVITHEASDIQNADYDVEAFDNKAYGEHLMEALAKLMDYEGEYAVYVGSLTSKTHNEWVDSAVALQKSKYPKMKLIADKIETNDNQQVAYAKTKQLLRAHPNVKGFEGSASTDVAGIGLAIEEAGLEGKKAVVGTSLPSIAKKYLPSGAVDMISFWDPADAGYVSNKVAVMVLNGQKITDGMDLGVKGYNKVKLVNGNKIYGQAWTDVTKDNLSQYDF
jgi:simple sugar transport system substrate-binding protein